ncbi:MAG TPA: L,D-transpeptidase family protein [Ktedonobacterales bacterium]
MAIATRGTTPRQTTTIHNLRPYLEHRVPDLRGVTLPLELRLILITTAVVVALVAAGAQIAGAIGLQDMVLAGQPGHTPASTAITWHSDGDCHAVTATPRMMSATELAHPHTPGAREARPGIYRPCQINGLSIPDPIGGAPRASGQVILVSLSQQWLWAYQNGRQVFANPVATGMPALRTPQGTFHIQYKLEDTFLYSPWPKSSPFYSSPTYIHDALHFHTGGLYISDAPSRQMFGPGAQNPHTTPNGKPETGSYGSVIVTPSAAAWLYHWASVGAVVMITD